MIKTSAAMALLATATLSACGPSIDVTAAPVHLNASTINAAHTAAAHDLFDPSSAQFREDSTFRLSNAEVVVCGQMNAKNRLGGYIGFSPYYVRMTVPPGGTSVAKHVEVSSVANIGCQQAKNGQIKIQAD
ncbi:MAG: hypothetical protein ACOH2H_16060 [Cypionkella sp.]